MPPLFLFLPAHNEEHTKKKKKTSLRRVFFLPFYLSHHLPSVFFVLLLPELSRSGARPTPSNNRTKCPHTLAFMRKRQRAHHFYFCF